MTAVHRIPLHGAPNARDLGGRTTADGRRIAYGRVYRSGALNGLTDADVDTLAGLGLRTVLDFRTPGEIAAAGEDRLPADLSATLLPIGGGDLDAYYNAGRDREAQRRLLGDGRAAGALAAINRGFVAREAERAAFAEALRLVADAGSLPLLFHCTAGKDRAGWLAAVLLTAVGVPYEQVLADYMRSNEYFAPVAEAMLARLAEAGLDLDPELFRPLMEQREEYLAAAFAEADERYGSFDGFLREGLGVDDALLARLRTSLLEPPATP